MRILVIGPSETKSHGGMATVIGAIHSSRLLNEKYEIDTFSSYIDGNLAVRMLYCAWAYLRFLTCYRKYDLFHIHVAAYGSTFRKSLYLKAIKRARKKSILHIHGSKYLVFCDGLSDKKRQKVARFFSEADMVLALSSGWKKEFEDRFHISNCRILNNGIDTKRFARAVTDIEKYKDSFLLLGRLGKRKGAYDLVDAVAIAKEKNPSIKVYMAGDGEVEQVRALVSEKHLEDHITIIGWVDLAGKLELLGKVSTVVLPSYNEGLPMSILEGMAAGKAIISTTVGAIPEVVSRENGILVEPGDIHSLADALVRCSADTDMLERMSQGNRQKMEESYSLERMHKLLMSYYEEAMR